MVLLPFNTSGKLPPMFKAIGLLGAACLVIPAFGAPIYVVAPNSFATVPGNSTDSVAGDC